MGSFGGFPLDEEEDPFRGESKAEPTLKGSAQLLLNGGGKTLDSATVPVEWFFSEALLAKKPQYIVICDVERSLDANDWPRERDSFGARYLVPVHELMHYIQLRRPGRHTIVCVIFFGEKEKARERARWFCEREGRSKSCYQQDIWLSDIENGVLKINESDAAVVATECEIPEALFATKGKSKIGKAFWDWVNLWWSRDPRDECEYRKRMISALTIQPLAFLGWRLLRGIGCTTYTLVVGFVMFLFGWRPDPFWRNFLYSWWNVDKFSSISAYGGSHFHAEWRLWRADFSGERRYIPVWAIPSILCVELAAVYGLVRLFMHYWRQILSTSIVIIIWIALFIMLLYVLKFIGCVLPSKKSVITQYRLLEGSFMKFSLHVAKRVKEIKDPPRSSEDEAKYWANLRNSTSLAVQPMPQRVEVAKVMKEVSPVTRFRLGFWAAKAKVCKPFAK